MTLETNHKRRRENSDIIKPNVGKNNYWFTGRFS